MYLPALLLTESEKRGEKAAEYAAKVSESDSLRQAAEIYYLDSVQNRPVYDLGFISFTYKEVKEKEINLGLDLKGGMMSCSRCRWRTC